MTSSVYYDLSGKIIAIRSGSRESCELDLQLDGRPGFITEEPVDFDTHFVVDGKLQEIPPKPSIEYVFDYAARKWVHDPAPARKTAMLDLRKRRNSRLTHSDWTQMPDAPLDAATKTAWQTYRQQLRDLPANNQEITSVDDVEFPTPPSL